MRASARDRKMQLLFQMLICWKMSLFGAGLNSNSVSHFCIPVLISELWKKPNSNGWIFLWSFSSLRGSSLLIKLIIWSLPSDYVKIVCMYVLCIWSSWAYLLPWHLPAQPLGCASPYTSQRKCRARRKKLRNHFTGENRAWEIKSSSFRLRHKGNSCLHHHTLPVQNITQNFYCKYTGETKTKTSLECLILLLIVPPLTMPLKWHGLNCM